MKGGNRQERIIAELPERLDELQRTIPILFEDSVAKEDPETVDGAYGALADVEGDVDAIFAAMDEEKHEKKRQKVREATRGRGGEQYRHHLRQAARNDMSGSALLVPDGQTQPVEKKVKAKSERSAVEAKWKDFFEAVCNQSVADNFKSCPDAVPVVIDALTELRTTLRHLRQPQLFIQYLTGLGRSRRPDVAIACIKPLMALMMQGREFDGFYTNLYRLLTVEVATADVGTDLIKIVTIALSSTGLNGRIVAAFVKRLLRLALATHPTVAVPLATIAVNALLQAGTRGKGQTVTALGRALLRTNAPASADADPYDPTEPDPSRAGAEHSSLWELQAMFSHYDSRMRRVGMALSDAEGVPPPAKVAITGLLGAEVAYKIEEEKPDAHAITLDKLDDVVFGW